MCYLYKDGGIKYTKKVVKSVKFKTTVTLKMYQLPKSTFFLQKISICQVFYVFKNSIIEMLTTVVEKLVILFSLYIYIIQHYI